MRAAPPSRRRPCARARTRCAAAARGHRSVPSTVRPAARSASSSSVPVRAARGDALADEQRARHAQRLADGRKLAPPQRQPLHQQRRRLIARADRRDADDLDLVGQRPDVRRRAIEAVLDRGRRAQVHVAEAGRRLPPRSPSPTHRRPRAAMPPTTSAGRRGCPARSPRRTSARAPSRGSGCRRREP